MQIITPQPESLGALISRASEGSFLNSENVLQYVSNNVARPSYNSNGDWLGVLEEGAATNLIAVDAQNFSASRTATPGWYIGADLGGFFTTSVSTDITAIDGTTANITKFERSSTSPGSGGLFARNWSSSGIPIGSYNVSLWVYVPAQASVDSFSIQAEFDNTGGATAPAITTFDRWVRVDIPMSPNTSRSFTNYTVLVNSAVAPQGFVLYAMNAQIETGSVPTSFIRTAGGTRAAETRTNPTNEARIVYSSVPLENIAEWTAGTYNAGDERIYQNDIYRAAATTTDRPDVGAAASPPTWVLRAPINRLRMFDLSRSEDVYTSDDKAIDVIVYHPNFFNGVSVINTQGGNALIEVINPGDVEPTQSVNNQLVSTFGINSWYKWYFEPRNTATRAVQTDINGRAGSLLRIRLDPRGGVARIGKLVVGVTTDIGDTQSGVSIRTVDQSPNERNEFGDVVLRPGRVTTVANFTVSVPFRQTDGITDLAKSLASTNTVFIGEGGDGYGVTILYGYAQEYEATLATGPQALYRITVESI